MTLVTALSAQDRIIPIHEEPPGGLTLMPPADSAPNRIPDFLPPEFFIPRSRLVGLHPWTSAPLPRPVVEIIPVYGFDGSIGFGEYTMAHPEKFFSTLEGYNSIDIPSDVRYPLWCPAWRRWKQLGHGHQRGFHMASFRYHYYNFVESVFSVCISIFTGSISSSGRKRGGSKYACNSRSVLFWSAGKFRSGGVHHRCGNIS